MKAKEVVLPMFFFSGNTISRLMVFENLKSDIYIILAIFWTTFASFFNNLNVSEGK